MFPHGIYEYVCARTKVIDVGFLEALEARFAQNALLGAGSKCLPITHRKSWKSGT
jgi:O-methyltransferase involved in polyketide biosynthesis